MGIKCPKCHLDNPDTASFCAGCGTRLITAKKVDVTEAVEVPKEELTPGSTFANKYQTIEELGREGTGKVYKALDTEVREKIAIKLIKPDIASDKKILNDSETNLNLFEKYSTKMSAR